MNMNTETLKRIQPSLANQLVAESIAGMVTEYIETGIQMKTDWRNGLANVIARRLARFDATPPQGMPELNDELRYILGRPSFAIIGLAGCLRIMGHDIKKRAEDEQAATIHWMLGHYLQHGADWRTQAQAQLEAADPRNAGPKPGIALEEGATA